MVKVQPGILEEIMLSIVRPFRVNYKLRDLGDKAIHITSGIVTREDFRLLNDRGHSLCASHFSPTSGRNRKVIIYLHGNSGCRADTRTLVVPFLSNNFDLICFDFSGSGISDGEFVSLGLNESEDLKTVMGHARNQLNYREIYLWGRSMGAVTGLRYCQMNPDQVNGLIADSPFCSFKELGFEIGQRRSFIPNMLIKVFINYLIDKIKDTYQIDLNKCDVLATMAQVTCPVLFIASREDELINSKHTEELFAKTPQRKKLIYVAGRHNDRREPCTIEEALSFFNKGHTLKRITHSMRGIEFLQNQNRNITQQNQTRRSSIFFTRSSKNLLHQNNQPPQQHHNRLAHNQRLNLTDRQHHQQHHHYAPQFQKEVKSRSQIQLQIGQRRNAYINV